MREHLLVLNATRAVVARRSLGEWDPDAMSRDREAVSGAARHVYDLSEANLKSSTHCHRVLSDAAARSVDSGASSRKLDGAHGNEALSMEFLPVVLPALSQPC